MRGCAQSRCQRTTYRTRMPSARTPNAIACKGHAACHRATLSSHALWTDVDASSSGAPQELTNFQRDGLGRARTWDRQAGAHFPSDASPRCAALSPVLGCRRRACCGKCPRPAATCHACLTSDTPACRPTPSQACLQSPQPLWQSAPSTSLRRSARSGLRAPLFNFLHLHRVPPRA